MDSKIGLLIQLNGVFLITVLSFFLRRSLKVTALKYWSIAWLCLSFSLICLRIGFDFEAQNKLFFSCYFLGEYIFGFMLGAGCRSFKDDYSLRPHTKAAILPLIALAFILPQLATDFNEVFNIHSLIMAGFFAIAFYQIERTKFRSFGWHVMHTALGLLALDFFLYFVVFTARHFADFSTEYMTYNSVVDLIFETMLGFGMVIVLLESVLAEFRKANEDLQVADERLETLVQTDPLTAAFNRHAFYGFVKKNGEENTVTSGCVGFFDIDGLKSINDCFGHGAGDSAIRAVVRAIRHIIRAEDLIYRWGGDEFFVIMISMKAEMAEKARRTVKGHSAVGRDRRPCVADQHRRLVRIHGFPQHLRTGNRYQDRRRCDVPPQTILPQSTRQPRPDPPTARNRGDAQCLIRLAGKPFIGPTIQGTKRT